MNIERNVSTTKVAYLTYRGGKLQGIIDEFLDSGDSVWSITPGPNEYTSLASCASAFTKAIKTERRQGQVGVSMRTKDNCVYLYRKDGA